MANIGVVNSLWPSVAFRPPKGTGKTSIVKETTDAGNAGISIPTAQTGIPVPAIMGRKRIFNPNVIWYGNPVPITETSFQTTTTKEEISRITGVSTTFEETTTTVKTTVVVGYHIDIMLGICLGPGVHMRALYSDNQLIWSGDLGPTRGTVVLPANDTALSGATLAFAGGNYDQPVDPDVSQADFPAHVGVAYLLIKHMRADVTLGPMSVEVERYPNPLGLAGGDNRIVNDLNAGSAIVEAITNPWGWGGLDIANINTAKLVSMSDTFVDEGNVVSVAILNEMSVTSLLEDLQIQTASIIYQDPETGLLTGNLVRYGPVDMELLPRFNRGNSLKLNNYQKTFWPTTIEQLRGVYPERSKNYEPASVFVQNPAALLGAGRGRRTGTIEYPYVPNATLALSCTARDMAILSGPVFSVEVECNRDGAEMVPGTVIGLTWNDYDMLNELCLVLKVRKQPIDLNTVVLQVRQARFPETINSFALPDTGYDPGIDAAPKTPPFVAFYTAPYWMARAANAINSVQASSIVYPLVLPTPFNDFQFSFTALVENMPGTADNVTVISDGVYPTTADLDTTIGLYDDVVDGIIALVDINLVVNPTALDDIGLDGVKAGLAFMLVGDEILSFEGVTDNGAGSWTLTNVHRGLLDTVAQAHAIGDKCYIIGNNYSNVAKTPFNYPLGYTPDWLIMSNTSGAYGQVADALSSNDWTVSANRTIAPPRPHNTKINGNARSSSPVALVTGASTTVTWATRSRSSSVVALQLGAAQVGEINDGDYQVHRVFVLDSSAVLWDCGVTADTSSVNTLTFNLPVTALGAGFLYVQAETTVNGVLQTSLSKDRLPVTIS